MLDMVRARSIPFSMERARLESRPCPAPPPAALSYLMRAQGDDALARFVHRKFDILLLHVADPDELHLPPLTAANFVDLETGDSIQIVPSEIRADYRARVERDRRHRA